MDEEEPLEAVHLALRLICEDELARLAPDLTLDELWAVAGQIQRRVGPKRGEIGTANGNSSFLLWLK